MQIFSEALKFDWRDTLNWDEVNVMMETFKTKIHLKQAARFFYI